MDVRSTKMKIEKIIETKMMNSFTATDQKFLTLKAHELMHVRESDMSIADNPYLGT